MRLVFSLTIILLIFTSCSNNLSLPNTDSRKNSTKTELISKANMGDIKAMIQLNKEYIFPETKEGFDYYNKWYPLVLKSKNSKDIMDFAKIFYEYKDMFLSGKKKYVDLLEASVSEKYKKALFELLEIYMYAYDHKKINDTEAKILHNASKDDLYTLYDFYLKKYKKNNAEKVEKLIKQKAYSLPPTKEFLRLKYIINRKSKKAESDKLLNYILMSDNYEKILQTGNLLEYRRRYKEAKPYYEKAIKLKNNEGKTYLEYANLYKKIISHHRVLHGKDEKYKSYQEEEIATLQKAIKYGEDEAYIGLLKIYSKEKYYTSDYNLLVKNLSKSTKGCRILAESSLGNFFTPDNKIEEYYKKAAEGGDKEAIMHLAMRVPNKYHPNKQRDKDIKKWQDFILNSNNLPLIEKLKKILFSARYKRNSHFNNIREAIIKNDLKNKNIFTLRKLYMDLKNDNPPLALKYLKEAASFGDVSSIYNLIKISENKRTKEGDAQALKMYEDLAIKGDQLSAIKAAYAYDLNKNKRDIKKALKYYEIASSLGEKSATRTLARIYLCGTCEDTKKFIDYKKAKFYAKKLVDEGEVKYTYNLGWLYITGNGVKKDVNKAIYYFKKSYNLYNEKTAAYNLGLIYEEGDDNVKKDLKLAKYWFKKANTKAALKEIEIMDKNKDKNKDKNENN